MTGVILINGLPGSGKSTLARELAATLDLPLFSKDACKESLWTGSRAPDPAESSALGRRAVALMWAAIAATPGPAVVESFWYAPRDLHLLRADLRSSGKSVDVEVWCSLAPATARQRCRTRERHRVHHAAENDGVVWAEWARQAAPLGLAPVLDVDTEEKVDVFRLCRALEQFTSGPPAVTGR
ncbi:AAA family ATPase [Pseudarthrobacter sp. So.54]